MTSKMISAAEWERIKSLYRHIPNDSSFEMPAECRVHNDWQRVYQRGCDSKYGAIMVSHAMEAWRHPTFDEFYGDAVVD